GEHILGALLVHGERRVQHARMGVGNPQKFQHALNAAIFAPPAMQRVEHHVRLGGEELGFESLAVVDLDHDETFLAQSLRAGTPRDQAHFAFGGQPAQEHGDFFHSAFSGIPTRLISHSSVTPDFALTRVRTSSPSPSMSAALASAVLMRKLQCFSETCASPRFNPRHPASSINCHALWPSGFLKVEPPVLVLTGWEASRSSTSLFMRARISSGAARVPSNTASIKITSSGTALLR